MKEIQLTQGKVALVDDEDFERANQFKWYAHKESKTFYAIRSCNFINGKQKAIKLHRFIMNVIDSKVNVDHIDHNGLNCQKNNLRECTFQQNTFNKLPLNKTSKYKGVCWHKNVNKFYAQIFKSGKIFYLGIYDNEIDAAKAYDTKAKELFGDFAYLNFKD